MVDPRQSRPKDLIFRHHTPIVFNGKVAVVEYWRTCDSFQSRCISLMLFMSNYVAGDQPGKG